MDLKKKLVLLSDRLDRLGMQKEADIIDLTLKTAIDANFAAELEKILVLDDEEVEADEEKEGF